MKKRGDRTVTELYDRTQKIPRSEIEGRNCKEEIWDITGHDLKEDNKDSPLRKRKMHDIESGVCNMCHAPCSSCFHLMKLETEVSSNCSETSSHASCCEHQNNQTKNKLKNPNYKNEESLNLKQEGQGENSSCVTKDFKKDKLNCDKSDVVSSLDKTEDKIRVSEKSLKIGDKIEERIRVSEMKDKIGDKIRVSEKIEDLGSSQDKIDSKIRVSEMKEKVDVVKIRVPEKNLRIEEKKLEIKVKFEEAKKDQRQDQEMVEATNNDSDNGLIDVKVCDICGDAGREELLATCTKCIDGAEHTYCMRIKMEKLPEGEWLCEECQLKEKIEKENKNKNKNKIITPRSTPRLEKENKNNLVLKNPFKRLRVNTDCTGSEIKVPASPKNVFKEPIMSPRNNIGNLSRENSIKNNDKLKLEKISPKSSQIVKGSNNNSNNNNNNNNNNNLSRSYSMSNINSPKGIEKVKSEILSPKGTLTKHHSFKTLSTNPKVKALTETLNPKLNKPKSTGLSISKPTQEKTHFRRLVKSSSLKEGSNFDSKKQFKPREEVEIEKEKEKEKKMVENKDLKKSRTGISVPIFKGNKKSEFGTSSSFNKDSGNEDKKRDLPNEEKKKLGSNFEIKTKKSFQILNETTIKRPSKWKPAIKTVISKSARPDGKNVILDKSDVQTPKSKVSVSNSTRPEGINVILDGSEVQTPKSRVSVSNSTRPEGKNVILDSSEVQTPKSRVLEANLVQKEKKDVICNNLEDKPRVWETNLVQKAKKDYVLRDQNAISNNLDDKSSVSETNLSEKDKKNLPFGNQNAICNNLGDKSRVSETNLSEKDIKDPLLGYQNAICNNLGDKSRVSETNLIEKSKKDPILRDRSAICNNLEWPSKSRVSNSSVLVEKLPKDTLSEIPVDLNSICTNSEDLDAKSPSNVMPVLDFVWQGNFEILRNGKEREIFEGIQAHFSNTVSPKVDQIVSKFSNNLKFEVVSCATSWPEEFRQIKPSQQHIALFFFAKDVQSYDNSYRRLLQNMLLEDLALKGNIQGVELLIYPSNKLPEPSQRWNNLFFLWGVFRSKKQEKVAKTSSNLPKFNFGPESSSFLIKINKNENPNIEFEKPNIEFSPKLEELSIISGTIIPTQNDLKKIKDKENTSNSLLSPPVLNRVMDTKNLTLEKLKETEAKHGFNNNNNNKRAHSSEEAESSSKRLRGHTESHIDDDHTESNKFLNILTSAKIRPLQIDLEKPAQTGEEEDLNNLNFDLGNKNKNPSFEPLALFPRVKVENAEDKSLSLSLSLPGLEIERESESKMDVKVQQFLPETPGVKKGQFRLFGGYIDP